METTIFTLFEKSIDIVDALIKLVIGIALVGFLWGVVRVLFSGEDKQLKTEGRSYMLYGILTLFVMTSLWAIVYLVKDFIREDAYGDVDSGLDEGIITPEEANPPLEDIDQLFDSNLDQRMI